MDRALKYLKKALDIYRGTIGAKHASTAVCFSSLGSVYFSKGEMDKALAHYTEALEIRIETRGNMHPSTAASYINIAEVRPWRIIEYIPVKSTINLLFCMNIDQ